MWYRTLQDLAPSLTVTSQVTEAHSHYAVHLTVTKSHGHAASKPSRTLPNGALNCFLLLCFWLHIIRHDSDTTQDSLLQFAFFSSFSSHLFFGEMTTPAPLLLWKPLLTNVWTNSQLKWKHEVEWCPWTQQETSRKLHWIKRWNACGWGNMRKVFYCTYAKLLSNHIQITFCFLVKDQRNNDATFVYPSELIYSILTLHICIASSAKWLQKTPANEWKINIIQHQPVTNDWHFKSNRLLSMYSFQTKIVSSTNMNKTNSKIKILAVYLYIPSFCIKPAKSNSFVSIVYLQDTDRDSWIILGYHWHKKEDCTDCTPLSETTTQINRA